MFVKVLGESMNIIDILANEDNDLTLFKLMKEKLKTIEIDAILITATDRDNSYCAVSCEPNMPFSKFYERQQKYYKDIPILNIYVRTSRNFIELNVNEQSNSFVDDNTTSSVIRLWREALADNNYDIDKYYDPDMMISVISFPKFYFISQIYALRDNVKSQINRMRVISPKEIYCSTMPSYNIIYENIKDYKNAQLNGEFEIIKSTIDKVLEPTLDKKYKSIVKEYDYVRFYHPEMDGFSWYGFARQD